MIVVDNAPEIRGYIERALGITITDPHRVLGFMTDAKRPLCAVAFSEFNGANIELTVVSQPTGLNRAVLRYIAHYAFQTLGCRRLTVRTKHKNKLAKKAALRVGFKYEAVVKRYFSDDDAVLYRMFNDECRWL